MKQDALNRYAAAKGFLESTKMIHFSPYKNEQNEINTFLSTHTLIGFALELYFKSWLIETGYGPMIVQKFGHKIDKLHEECIINGLRKIEGLSELVDLLKVEHGETYAYRYLDNNHTYSVANWDVCIPVVDELDVAVDQYIGASASKGLAAGH